MQAASGGGSLPGRARPFSAGRLAAVAAWVLVTVVATTLSWAGVSLVTSEVTDGHASLSADRVAALIEAPAGVVAADSSPAASTPVPVDSPATPPPPVAPAGGPATASAAPATTVPGRASATTTTTAPKAVPVPAPATSPPPGTSMAATFSGRGGVISVVCAGDAITLLGARPLDGYRLTVRDDGPKRVVVEFTGRPSSTLGAECEDGRPVAHHEAPNGDDDRGGRRPRDGPG